MTWRLAESLRTLIAQVNIEAPNRSKRSDGTIGDAEHATRVSDHNPNSSGVVTAVDLTHDPDHGADMNRISDALLKSRDPRIKYVIWNRRLFSTNRAPFWEWRAYTGPSPHDKHMHVSVVGVQSLWDDVRKWSIGADMLTTKEEEVVRAILKEITPEDAKDLKDILESMRKVGSNPSFVETLILDHRKEVAEGR